MNLQQILDNHSLWLKNKGGSRADLSGADLSGAKLSEADLSWADLSGANLSKADLSEANLSGADLSGANLSKADLSKANLSGADLSKADLSWADLSWADLSKADLSGANLSKANLSGANLSKADLSWANLSGAAGLLISSVWMKENFNHSKSGWIVYKTFNSQYTPSPDWKIESNSYITENVNPNRTDECGCGVNFATIEWIEKNCSKNIKVWECLIEWQDACDIVVAYNTDGKARCGRIKLLRIIE